MSEHRTQTTPEQNFREALEEIKRMAFFHMVSYADERGDRKVLGEIKEITIKALAENPDG